MRAVPSFVQRKQVAPTASKCSGITRILFFLKKYSNPYSKVACSAHSHLTKKDEFCVVL